MQEEFKSMMGELTFFIGLQIKQEEDEILINQTKYIRKIIKKFGTSLRSVSTLMNNTCKLDNNEREKHIDLKLYRGMIGSLLYLTTSRPNILFSVCMYARFQSDPRENHYLAIKRIFKFLKGTQELGLWYSKSSSFELIAYSNSDFAGCRLNRRITSGTCHFLRGNLIS